MFIVGVIAAAIVVVTALYLVSIFIALVIDDYKWQKEIEKRACTCGNRHKLGDIEKYQFNTP